LQRAGYSKTRMYLGSFDHIMVNDQGLHLQQNQTSGWRVHMVRSSCLSYPVLLMLLIIHPCGTVHSFRHPLSRSGCVPYICSHLEAFSLVQCSATAKCSRLVQLVCHCSTQGSRKDSSSNLLRTGHIPPPYSTNKGPSTYL
jgi:hypothetical protein